MAPRIEKPLSTVQTGPQGRPGGRIPTNRSRGQTHNSIHLQQKCTMLIIVLLQMGFSSVAYTDRSVSLSSGKVHSLPLSSVYTWGSGISTPLRLPMLNTEVLQVSLGRTQRMGVTRSGRLITWEVCTKSVHICFMFTKKL